MDFLQVISPDVVDVLRHEHEQIRRLCTDLPGAERARQKQLLATLQQAVHLHQLGEVTVVHPAVRTSSPNGGAIALDCQVKGAQLERSLAELGRLGVEHPDFDAGFGAVSDGLLDHAVHQESDEFPLLRHYVPTQRLHTMTGAMRDVRIMALS